MGADRSRRVGTVDAIDRTTEIHGASAQRITGTTSHLARQIGLARDHLHRRGPIRPLRLLGDRLYAGPGKAVAADADAVTDGLAAAEHVIEISVGRIDDDGAGCFAGRVVDGLALQSRRQFDRAAFTFGRRGLHGRRYVLRRRHQEEGEKLSRRRRGGRSGKCARKCNRTDGKRSETGAATGIQLAGAQLEYIEHWSSPCLIGPVALAPFRRLVAANH